MAGSGLDVVRQNVSTAILRMTGPQRVTLGLAFAATVIGMFLVSRVTGGVPMGMLYAGLDPSAAADVVDQLEAQGVEYSLSDGGRVIMVPTDQVHSLRLDMSSQGLPAGNDGWSILDNQGITTSDFDQRVGFQRAMEGELAKTISAIDNITDADVHLVMPKDDLFVSDDVQASASVLLVSGGQPITPMQVEAIVNLISSSVEGLSPDRVSITDETGRILAAPGAGSSAVGLEGDSRIRTQRQFESEMEADLEALLATVVGPGMAVVNVAAELDFDSVVTVTEEYQPTEDTEGNQTVLAETTRNEIYRGDDGADETGILGIETAPFEAPGDGLDAGDENNDEVIDGVDADNAGTATGAAADPSVKYSLDERDATYAMNKVITNAESAAGEVESISVAVLLDETAIDASRIGEIETLVQAAAGLNDQRGDTLAVSLMPINDNVRAAIEAQNTPLEEEAASGLDLIGLIRTVGSIIVAILVLMLGLRYVRKGGKRQVLDSVDLAALEGGALALEAGEDATDQGDPADVKLQGLIANQPDEVAGVLRSWLNEAEQAAIQ